MTAAGRSNYFCQLCGRSMGAELGTAHSFCADFRRHLLAEQARTDLTALTEAANVVARAKQRRDELAQELSPSSEDTAERVAIEHIVGVPAPAQSDPMLEMLDFTGPEGAAKLSTFVERVVAALPGWRVPGDSPELSDEQAQRVAAELTRRLTGRRLPMVVIDYVLGECMATLHESRSAMTRCFGSAG